jgi:hypothetical protein
VKTELLTIRTAPRFIIRPREAEGREGLLEAALARWQAVLSAAGRRSASEEPWLVNTLAETVHAAESLAARPGTEIPIPLRQHLEGLRRQSERLKLPKATDNPMAAAFARSLANTDRNKADTAGTSSGQSWTRSDSQEVSGGVPGSGDWLINRPAVDALLGILAALVVGLIVWTGARAWSWFQHQEPLAWTALGTFWWLALRPSALGLALVAWGAIRVVQILKARRAEAPAPAASI